MKKILHVTVGVLPVCCYMDVLGSLIYGDTMVYIRADNIHLSAVRDFAIGFLPLHLSC